MVLNIFDGNNCLRESSTLRTVGKARLLAVTNMTFAKFIWYLTELLNPRSQIRYMTLKVR